MYKLSVSKRSMTLGVTFIGYTFVMGLPTVTFVDSEFVKNITRHTSLVKLSINFIHIDVTLNICSG